MVGIGAEVQQDEGTAESFPRHAIVRHRSNDVDTLTGMPPEQFDVRPVKKSRLGSWSRRRPGILWRGRERRDPRWSRGRDGLWRGGSRHHLWRWRGRRRMGSRPFWILKAPRDE